MNDHTDPFDAYQAGLLRRHALDQRERAHRERSQRRQTLPAGLAEVMALLRAGPLAEQVRAIEADANVTAPGATAHGVGLDMSQLTVSRTDAAAHGPSFDMQPLTVSNSGPASFSPAADAVAHGHSDAHAKAMLRLDLAPLNAVPEHLSATTNECELPPESEGAERAASNSKELTPLNTPSISHTHTLTSISDAISSISDTGAERSEDQPAYSSRSEITELFARHAYAAHLGFPLNAHLTVLLVWHDRYGRRPILDLIESISTKLKDFARNRGIPNVHLTKLMNDRAGGRGLHLHVCLHIPEIGFADHASALEAGLAGCFRTCLTKRARRHSLHKARMSAHAAYLALRDRRLALDREATLAEGKARRLPAATSISLQHAARSARGRARGFSLPFWLSNPNGGPYQPLSGEYAAYELPAYLARDADPSIIVQIHGEDVPLSALSRNVHGAGWEPQSSKRPAVALRSSANLHPRNRAADPTWHEPTINLGEKLITHDPGHAFDPRSARRRARWAAVLKAHAARFGTDAEPKRDTTPTSCSAALECHGSRSAELHEIAKELELIDINTEPHSAYRTGICYNIHSNERRCIP